MFIKNLHLKGSTKCDGAAFLQRIKSEQLGMNSSDLYLIREKDNKYDTNAVQVWCNRNGKNVRLGYIEKEQAPEVAYYLDRGWTVQITDHNICGSADTNYGLYFTARMTNPDEDNRTPIMCKPQLRKCPF